MGLFGLMCAIVWATAAYAWPAYASFKALKTNEPEVLEQLLMYWIVLGIVTSIENTVEWAFSWIPFYSLLKMTFLVTLACTQFSTILYEKQINPFLLAHEREIDAAIIQAKTNARSAGLGYVNQAWTYVRKLLMESITGADQAAPSYAHGPIPGVPGNTSAAATSGMASFAGDFARRYGPAAVAAAQSVLNPTSARQPSAAAYDAAESAVRDSYAGRRAANASTASRREQLEAELRELVKQEQAGLGHPSSTATGASLFPGSHYRSVSDQPTSNVQSRGDRRAPSAGGSPWDPVADRFEGSLLGQSGYETIGHEDANGFDSFRSSASSSRNSLGGRTTSGIMPVPEIGGKSNASTPAAQSPGWGRWMWGGGGGTPPADDARAKKD